MKLFLDCEFTQLNQDTKLISLALVSEARDEFYVELTDTYKIEDCSDFVIQHVLPQLDQLRYGRSLVDAQAALRVFLGGLDGQLEVCPDAPEWDWEFSASLRMRITSGRVIWRTALPISSTCSGILKPTT